MGALRVRHDWVTSLSHIGEGNGNPLQCSCLENRAPGEPGGLPSTGSHRVGQDWSDLAATAAKNLVIPHISLTKNKQTNKNNGILSHILSICETKIILQSPSWQWQKKKSSYKRLSWTLTVKSILNDNLLKSLLLHLLGIKNHWAFLETLHWE